MRSPWSIASQWHFLDQGDKEERAAFAALDISVYGVHLTEGLDLRSQSSRTYAYLSAYHLAKWFAWNWWRICHEPARQGLEWEDAHNMASIGFGYAWPSIKIVSDGKFVRIVSKPHSERNASFRYITECDSMVAVRDFEHGVNEFCEHVANRLLSQHISEDDSDFLQLWSIVKKERASPELTRRRKIEALLGIEPDTLEDDKLAAIEHEATLIGQGATEELAAASQTGKIASLKELTAAAEDATDLRLEDAIVAKRLAGQTSPLKPAWEYGVSLAKRIRASEKLDQAPIKNLRLASMLGTSPDVLKIKRRHNNPLDFGYIVSPRDRPSKIVLRAESPHSRRFELARLLGDHLMSASDKLHPATKAVTYRQKAQRAFAAELLAPILAIREKLAEDLSDESIEKVAYHFNVTPTIINYQLQNNSDP